jgi:hypothetical protein
MESLTPERFRELWSQTYNTQGKPDWSHLFPYYHDDIIFEDSIQRIEGKVEFMAMCNRLAQRCEQLNMDILSIVMDGQEVFFQWKIVMSFKRWPSNPVIGCTKLPSVMITGSSINAITSTCGVPSSMGSLPYANRTGSSCAGTLASRS